MSLVTPKPGLDTENNFLRYLPLPRVIPVKIESRHLEEGIIMDCSQCPVALAVAEYLCLPNWAIQVNSRNVYLSKSVTDIFVGDPRSGFQVDMNYACLEDYRTKSGHGLYGFVVSFDHCDIEDVNDYLCRGPFHLFLHGSELRKNVSLYSQVPGKFYPAFNEDTVELEMASGS